MVLIMTHIMTYVVQRKSMSSTRPPNGADYKRSFQSNKHILVSCANWQVELLDRLLRALPHSAAVAGVSSFQLDRPV